MDKKTIEDKIKEIISERLGTNKENVKPESKLSDDLGMDSFALVELSFEIEDKFDVKIENSGFNATTQLKDVIDYIYNKLAQK